MNVLQVIGFLGRGGDTTAVLGAMGKISDDEIHFDFITHKHADELVVDQLRREGHKVQVLDGDVRKLKLSYASAFEKAVQDMDVHYDAVHVHTGMQSGIALHTAKKLGITRRICHSHVGAIQRYTSTLQRTVLERPLRKLYLDNATSLVACSNVAGDFLFGDRDYQVLYNGVDINLFNKVDAKDSERLRAEFGCAPDTILIGQVAHFSQPKNQAFMLDVAKCFANNNHYRFALIGRGSDFERTVAQAREMRLDNVIFPGQRNDMPRVMAALDCLALPSLPGEGFPMTILEAISAGTPCLVSTNITDEVGMFGNMASRLDLTIETWQRAISNLIRKNEHSKMRGRAAIMDNNLDIDSFALQWAQLYRQE